MIEGDLFSLRANRQATHQLAYSIEVIYPPVDVSLTGHRRKVPAQSTQTFGRIGATSECTVEDLLKRTIPAKGILRAGKIAAKGGRYEKDVCCFGHYRSVANDDLTNTT